MRRPLLLAALLQLTHGQVAPPQPTAEQIIARMVAADEARTATLKDYTSIRRYSLDNKRFGVHATLTARVTYRHGSGKTYEILAQSGPGAIRSRVFKRMLDTEVQASRADASRNTRVSPDNYEFRLIGSTASDGRPCYEFQAKPRNSNPLLFRGKICVDAEDYAVTRIDGEPAKNPSFWLRKTVIAHRYGKFGPFWLPVENQSGSEVTVFGHTDVRIEYTDYRINADSPATDTQ